MSYSFTLVHWPRFHFLWHFIWSINIAFFVLLLSMQNVIHSQIHNSCVLSALMSQCFLALVNRNWGRQPESVKHQPNAAQRQLLLNAEFLIKTKCFSPPSSDAFPLCYFVFIVRCTNECALFSFINKIVPNTEFLFNLFFIVNKTVEARKMNNSHSNISSPIHWVSAKQIFLEKFEAKKRSNKNVCL